MAAYTSVSSAAVPRWPRLIEPSRPCFYWPCAHPGGRNTHLHGPVGDCSYDIMMVLMRHLHCFGMKAHQFHGLHCPGDDLWLLLSSEIAPENGCSVKTGIEDGGDGEVGVGGLLLSWKWFIDCGESRVSVRKMSYFQDGISNFPFGNTEAPHKYDIQQTETDSWQERGRGGGREEEEGRRVGEGKGKRVTVNPFTKSACRHHRFSFPTFTNSL